MSSRYWYFFTVIDVTYHQETDRQTERVIRIFKQLLRCGATRRQTSWLEQLPAIEFAYISSSSSSSSYSPFYLCNSYMPKTPISLLSTVHHPQQRTNS